MNRTYLRGDMYYADLGHGIGSEQEGYRPVVIIQNDVGNKHSPTVIIASITSKKDAKPKLPTHYYIGIEAGLELPSIVLLEQLRTVDKRRLSEFIGHLPEKHIQGINHALAISIGLIDSVPKKVNPLPLQHLCQQFLWFRCFCFAAGRPGTNRKRYLHLLQ